jgi:Transposase IS200 like
MDGKDDHVHLLVAYPSHGAVARLVNSLKGVSARRLRQRYRVRTHREHLWSPSYFAASAGDAPLETLRPLRRWRGKPTLVLGFGVSSECSTEINGALLEHLGGDLDSSGEPGYLFGGRPVRRNHEHAARALTRLPAVECIDQVKPDQGTVADRSVLLAASTSVTRRRL